jgi:competence ComEA-like helix-hairpin-helix protein
MKRWLYKVQQMVAITEVEARALGVVFFLLVLGLGGRYGLQRWGVPDPVEPLFIAHQATLTESHSMGEADSSHVAGSVSQSSPDPAGPEQRAPRTPRPPGPVNVNTATSQELQRLPGIGPAMATRIIEHRTQHGPFRTVSDLLAVKGIGEKTLAKLAPLVTVGE